MGPAPVSFPVDSGQGWSCSWGSPALRHKPDACRRWKLLWLCLKGGLSPFSQGLGPSGAAEPALCTASAAMLKPCGQFTCFQIYITSPKIQPRFVLRSYQRLREPGTDLWLPIKIMWFYHETWKLCLHFSFGDVGFAPGSAPRVESVNPSGREHSGAASAMEEIGIAARRIFDVRTTQPSL